MPENRNSENRFSSLPISDIGRSKIPLDFTHKTTANAGVLVPFMREEVVAGDVFDVNTHAVIRMTTPIYPTMDNLDIDFYYFYYPRRHMSDHFKEIFGENTKAKYIPTEEYELPIIKTGEGKTILKGSLLDHLALPTEVENQKFLKEPIIMTAEVWNNWFRDQNLQDPVNINKGDADTVYEGKDPYNWTLADLVTDFETGRMCPPVNKNHDYFSSALIDSQKGTPVSIPIGGVGGKIPVMTGEFNPNISTTPMMWSQGAGQSAINYSGAWALNLVGGTDAPNKDTTVNTTLGATGSATSPRNLRPANLYAITETAGSSTINDLRKAMALQHFLEVDAMSGTRYRELLLSHFKISAPDSTFEIPEYLGGSRHPINIETVVQSSATNEVSPQGNAAGYSVTGVSEHSFTKGFVEPGLVMGFFCIRVHQNTYQNGRARYWDERTRFDIYWPELRNLGFQGIKNSELHVTGTAKDDEIFGYNERWSQYRHHRNEITGAFRSNYAQSLDSWHYGQTYEDTPKLSGEWVMEDRSAIDRTLTVTSELEDQFILDIYVDNKATRPIPLYSIPGLKGWF